jgi:hypothetical protein
MITSDSLLPHDRPRFLLRGSRVSLKPGNPWHDAGFRTGVVVHEGRTAREHFRLMANRLHCSDTATLPIPAEVEDMVLPIVRLDPCAQHPLPLACWEFPIHAAFLRLVSREPGLDRN